MAKFVANRSGNESVATSKWRFICIFSAVVVSGLVSATSVCAQEPVTVFAAASVRQAIESAVKPFTASTGIPVRFSFGATSALAKQIEEGKQADLFISADLGWMSYLSMHNLVRSEGGRNLMSNKLVMIAPRQSSITEIKLDDAASMKVALGANGHLAVAEVMEVPAGRYAKSALENLGLWSDISERIIMAEDVEAAVDLVARNDAPLGIAYATDAAAEPRVKVVAVFPDRSHPKILYAFARTTASKSDEAAKLLTYLKSSSARSFFEKGGFTFISSAIDVAHK